MIHSPQTRETALLALSTGASYSIVSARIGVSQATLKRWWQHYARVEKPRAKSGRRPKAKPAPDDIALAGRWVRDGLIWRHEKEAS